MSVTNLNRYGTTEAPTWAIKQRRKDRAADRKARLQDLKRYSDAVAAERQIIRFEPAEFEKLSRASARGIGGPSSFWGVTAAGACEKGGKHCIRISAETAAAWAVWLRQPEMSHYGDTLQALDDIAGSTRPEGSAIKIRIAEFHAILAILEGPDQDAIPSAKGDAEFLRKARVECGLIYVYVTPTEAAHLAEVFVAAKVDRGLILCLDRIAGRTELRPF